MPFHFGQFPYSLGMIAVIVAFTFLVGCVAGSFLAKKNLFP